MSPFLLRIQATVLIICNQLFGLPLLGYHHLWRIVPNDFESTNEAVHRHHIQLHFCNRSERSIPFSIALTHGIAIAFFSSAY